MRTVSERRARRQVDSHAGALKTRRDEAHLKSKSRFADDVLRALRDGKILGIRAGTGPHRVIGIWVVVVESRVFVRSWSLGAGGWYRTLVEEPRGVISVEGRELPVRAVRTRSERLMDAIDLAYRAKYHTPGSVKYVRDLCRPKCRASTTELVPRPPVRVSTASRRGSGKPAPRARP